MNLLKGDSNWTLLIWKIEDDFAIAQIYGDDILLGSTIYSCAHEYTNEMKYVNLSRMNEPLYRSCI